ncbi:MULTISPECIES: hypothetical protein [unclassified Rhodococcus (in: high G+C Gram-positive bacteria)]|uniref:hypothetical protein n=1 Tax=unclassified Rhodococcus (in: high G+C Gram-positive bacteria) TaxID=192944 RepID=UPI000702228E|nr:MULTISPECIES: hypothetical protein [unclassified Rhodococcus (in: high G+C Gram-positive bacteria)]KQU39212.1 hypothetical protein ASG69_12115 [Rhodococcus sp. Leaf225]KQU43648.1 hypothetical protein ASH03_13790 [Rhodococcus sp. Leaf258]
MAEKNFYSHSDAAEKSRRDKAVALARYLWDRDISADDLAAMAADVRRKVARAADINPPSSDETWTVVSTLLREKAEWALDHPDHDAVRRAHADEKILWVKPPVQPWR